MLVKADSLCGISASPVTDELITQEACGEETEPRRWSISVQCEPSTDTDKADKTSLEEDQEVIDTSPVSPPLVDDNFADDDDCSDGGLTEEEEDHIEIDQEDVIPSETKQDKRVRERKVSRTSVGGIPKKSVSEADTEENLAEASTSSRSTHKSQEKRSGKYQCETCNKCFVKAQYLRDHIRTHTGEKPYMCEECGKAFACRKNLRTHKRIHTGEKRYKCDVCVKSFGRLRTLRLHKCRPKKETEKDTPKIKSKKDLKAEKQSKKAQKIIGFKCETCGKRFSNQYYLKYHIRIHTGDLPFQCDICGKSFAQRPTLAAHLQRHSGQKNHHCTICDKSFAMKGDLNLHVKMHTGEKPHVCEICGKSFSRSFPLV